MHLLHGTLTLFSFTRIFASRWFVSNKQVFWNGTIWKRYCFRWLRRWRARTYTTKWCQTNEPRNYTRWRCQLCARKTIETITTWHLPFPVRYVCVGVCTASYCYHQHSCCVGAYFSRLDLYLKMNGFRAAITPKISMTIVVHSRHMNGRSCGDSRKIKIAIVSIQCDCSM